MYQPLSDQSITGQINKAFSNNIDQKMQSISDTTVIQGNQGRLIAYFAKNKLKQLILVQINVDAQQNNAVKILKVQSNTQLPVQKLSIQMKKCPYEDDIYALIITDLAKPKGRNKSIFFTSIPTEQTNQNQSVHLTCSYVQRQQQLKDLVWHPYSPFTFMVLLESKIQVYNAQNSVYEPQSQFIIQDLKVKNCGQRIAKGSIQKLNFCDDFNQQKNLLNQLNNLSSFGKKISLFVINNKGNIFMLFPFLVKKIILNKDQQFEALKLIRDPQTKRQIQIQKLLKASTILSIQPQQQNHQKAQYFLQFKVLPNISQFQAFKLNNLNNHNNHLQTKVMINSFSVFTLAKTTIFVYSTRKKQGQLSLFIDAFSQNPYRKMFSENKYDKSQNFNCQRINEIKFGKVSEEYGSFKIFVDQFENILYAYVNRKACFKISLDGFVKIINATNKEQQLYDIKLVEMDVLFNSKTSFTSLAYFESMIYLVKHSKSYSFTSVPLQSLQLKEKIRQTNEQTQKLFEKLAKTNERRKQKIPVSQPVDMKQLSEASLSQIQKKLQTFSLDYKKSVQKKIQSIKTLYENIQQKTIALQQHDKLKNQIVQSLNKAQQNDQKIKQIVKKGKKDKNQIQKQFSQRLQRSAKLLAELKQKIDVDLRKKSPEQQQILNDCEEQADGIIKCLEVLKEKLLKKKFQLQREFGASSSVRLQKESYIYK